MNPITLIGKSHKTSTGNIFTVEDFQRGGLVVKWSKDPSQKELDEVTSWLKSYGLNCSKPPELVKPLAIIGKTYTSTSGNNCVVQNWLEPNGLVVGWRQKPTEQDNLELDIWLESFGWSGYTTPLF